MKRCSCIIGFAALLAAGLPDVACGQADSVRAELTLIGSLRPPGLIVATVAGKEIDVAKINRLVKLSLRGRPITRDALPGLEAQSLEQAINRQLVRTYVERKKIDVTKAEIDKAFEARAKNAHQQGLDLADELGRAGQTMADYRDDLEWELRWTKYLQTEINDEVLEQFFNARHKDFDGTEVRVSHILLRPDGRTDPPDFDALKARAEIIRNEITAEISTFADAAKKYSVGPSRHNGGDIGIITRHGVMPEEFTSAAFALEKGEISPPVKSSLGVHLIECTEIRPGKKTWRDVRKELLPALTQNAFQQVSGQMRKSVSIEYSDKFPHLDPKTGELVKVEGEEAADDPQAAKN